MITRSQDEALLALVRLIRTDRGPAADAALTLVDAIRRGDESEQQERTRDLDAITKKIAYEALTPVEEGA